MGKVFEDKVINAVNKNSNNLIKRYAMALPEKYKDIDFYPPQGVIDNAKRALKVRNEKPASQRGMTPVGIARARDLSNRRPMSPDTIKRMVAYFTRHEVDKQGETWEEYGKGRQAWDGWGGDAGYTWAKKVLRQMENADEKLVSLSEKHYLLSDLQRVSISFGEDVSKADWIIGKPFKTLALGTIYSRVSASENNVNKGKPLSNEISIDILKEIDKVYRITKEKNPVIIDWNHNSSSETANPLSSISYGEIIDMEVREDGLWVTPAYTKQGAEIVKMSEGSLWSSPEFLLGKIYDRETGSLIGTAQMLAVTLTNRPAQPHNKIDRVSLMEKFTMEYTQEQLQAMPVEELAKLCMEKHQLVKSLEAEKEGMKNELEMLKSEMDLLAQEEKAEPAEPPEHIMEGEYKMSEAQANLLTEIKAQNIQLSERIKKLESEKHQAERKLAVDNLLNSGKITPSELSVAEKAYDLKATDTTFWNMFSERKANQAVNLQEIGTKEKSSDAPVFDQVKAIAKEKGISFSEALDVFKIENKNTYFKHFGG
jgi:hypothetical protein